LVKDVIVRKGRIVDAPQVESLLCEWLSWRRRSRRTEGSVKKALKDSELLVAQSGSHLVGFIHYVMHEDIIDGEPNAFITAFYVSTKARGVGTGTALLEGAIADSLSRGAVGVETSTLHSYAKRFYEKKHFKQAFFGDIKEAFLELDVEEYLNSKRASGLRPATPRRASS
jgi:GNAT superfamily N-acetyltransferase